MKASILAVGEELLAPGRRETNSTFLTTRLARLGIPVALRAVVGDEAAAIARAATTALATSEIVFLSGGLGPTDDDRTRDAVSAALGLKLSLDADQLERIESRFRDRGIGMPDVNRRQALVPDGASILVNHRGTAPGLWIPVPEGKTVVLLPGPPAELEPMFGDSVEPRLAGISAGVVYDTLKLWVTGLPESVLEEMIGAIYQPVDNPSTTVLASGGQIELRLTASAPKLDLAREKNEALAARLEAVLGAALFGRDEDTLESVVGSLLARRRERVSIAESVTGGLIASRLTDVPGSSAYFDESVVTYSNEAKSSRLGVPSPLFETVGAVSAEVAEAMAVGVRERSGSAHGVSVTGIAGPGGATPDKPVGLVFVAVDNVQGTRVERHRFNGSRQRIKRWTSQAALDLLRRSLLR